MISAFSARWKRISNILSVGKIRKMFGVYRDGYLVLKGKKNRKQGFWSQLPYFC